jgi:hypothetical protein
MALHRQLLLRHRRKRPPATRGTFAFALFHSAAMVAAAATAPPPFRMVALDLDGTLLNRKHEASAAAVEILRELHAAGVVVALCSGRSQVAMYPTARQLQLPEVPMVCFNGALGLRCTKAFLSGGEAKPHEIFTTAVPEDAAHLVLTHAASRGELVSFLPPPPYLQPPHPVPVSN